MGKRLQKQPEKAVSFSGALNSYYEGYADIRGRSSRKECFYVLLPYVLICLLLYRTLPDYLWLWLLATAIPTLSLLLRRLRDAGSSPAWLAALLIPVVGPLILLVQLCQKSKQ